MSDHKLCSATETQDSKNIIALAELLCEKGILQESELIRIFTPEVETESHDSIEKFPLDLLPETAGFAGESPENIDANTQKIYDFMDKNSISGK